MTDDDKALVERLAAEADNFKVAREVDMRAMLYRAADRIEALSAENERLRMHLDVALETLAEEGVCGDECNTCKEARAALGETE